jgi:predicted ATPase
MSRVSTTPRESATLVGRQAELSQLDAAFAAATAGHGSVTLLVGEPGIGKTALCEWLVDRVNGDIGMALTGHCYQEKSASLPYQPFVEAFENYARGLDATRLCAELGSSINEIARIAPAIQDQLHVEPSRLEDPEDDRRRLFTGIQAFLRRVGDQQPLLIVLDDLHDADQGTLDLLGYLAHHISRTRLLLLGTFRDVEVDRAHPLSAALADLRRSRQLNHIQLTGLSPNEVQGLLAIATATAVPRCNLE